MNARQDFNRRLTLIDADLREVMQGFVYYSCFKEFNLRKFVSIRG
jgi:hypothetical protein